MMHRRRTANANIVQAISRDLSRSNIYLSDIDIEKHVEELEFYFGNYELRDANDLIGTLRAKFVQDRASGSQQGLYRSRRQFYISCYAARHMHCSELAKALFRFVERNAADIDSEEMPYLKTEWCHGVLQLRAFVDDRKLREITQKLGSHAPQMFEEWRRIGPQGGPMDDMYRRIQDVAFPDHGRGRHHHRNFGYQARGMSVPARSSSFVDLSSFSHTGYTSPLMRPTYGAFDLLFEQQYRQQRDIARLECCIEDLGHR